MRATLPPARGPSRSPTRTTAAAIGVAEKIGERYERDVVTYGTRLRLCPLRRGPNQTA